MNGCIDQGSELPATLLSLKWERSSNKQRFYWSFRSIPPPVVLRTILCDLLQPSSVISPSASHEALLQAKDYNPPSSSMGLLSTKAISQKLFDAWVEDTVLLQCN